LLALASLTGRTLPHLQRVLDAKGDVLVDGNDVHLRPLTVLFGGVSDQEGTTMRSFASTNCLKHEPLSIVSAFRVGSREQSSSSTISPPPLPLIQPAPSVCGRLRRNWTNVQLLSPIAKRLEAHQSDCSLPVVTDHVDDSYGMGSHLYVWSQALCNALESRHRLLSVNPSWLWMDRTHCDYNHDAVNNWTRGSKVSTSPFACYFPLAEERCGRDTSDDGSADINVTDPRHQKMRCSLVRTPEGLAAFRAAAMEYLFQTVSPLVLGEAERQLGLLFPGGVAPSDLITVHMRWGDKFWEMQLASEHEYVGAVCQLLSQKTSAQQDHYYSDTDCNATVANIYLASEDPRAVNAFQQAAPSGWKVYVDRTVVELDAFRPSKGNRASWTARNTQGRAGLVALGSLLVALEANYFVLTTQSNWSRLMNELRKNVIDPRCENCTRIVDLRPGQW